MKIALCVMCAALTLLYGSPSHAQSSSKPIPESAPLPNLAHLYREASPQNGASEQARRSRCDSATEVFFDWWVPEVMNQEAEPLRRELSALSFQDSTPEHKREHVRAYNRLAPSMSILTSKFMIAQTYRTNLERRCQNSSQQDEVTGRLSALMSDAAGTEARSLDGIIAALSDLAASAGSAGVR